MANCVKCGKTISKGVKFCPSCGAAVGSAAKSTKTSAKSTKTPAKSTRSSGRAVTAQEKENYKNFGGWLLFFYWCEIIGGVLTFIFLLVGLLTSIAAASLYSSVYSAYSVLGVGRELGVGIGTSIIGAVISMISIAVATVFYIKSAIQMKAAQPRFFDTFIMGAIISFGGSLIGSLFSGIGSFISSLIFGAIGLAIGLGLVIMYFQKSVRVKVYFNSRPLHDSRHWNIIERLPEFVVSEEPLFK